MNQCMLFVTDRLSYILKDAALIFCLMSWFRMRGFEIWTAFVIICRDAREDLVAKMNGGWAKIIRPCIYIREDGARRSDAIQRHRGQRKIRICNLATHNNLEMDELWILEMEILASVDICLQTLFIV